MQQKQPASARTPHAARRTARRMTQAGTIPAQHAKQQQLAASFRHDATRQHATCPLQRRRYDTHHATAAARNDGLRLRRPCAPAIRTQLQASGKRDPNGPPLAAGTRTQGMTTITMSRACARSQRRRKCSAPHYAQHATHTPNCPTPGAGCAACNVQHATRNIQRTACTPPYPNCSDAVTNTAPKRTKLALRSIQRATRSAQAYNVHLATCKAQHPSAT